MTELNEHATCFCCSGEEEPLVKSYRVNHEEIEEEIIRHNNIIFVVEGNLSISVHQDASGSKLNVMANAGDFLLLPSGCRMRYKAFSKSTIFMLRLISDMHASKAAHCVELLYEEIKQADESMTTEEKKQFGALTVSKRLQHFVDGLITAWNDGLRCVNYFEAEITKLIILLPRYYSKEDLCKLFHPIFSPNTFFSEYVKQNWKKYFAVNRLSEAMNMSPQQFARQFSMTFGQTPREWMQREKALVIHKEICQTNKQFKDIAVSYGFTDQSNFNRFCKKFYNLTPKELRKSASISMKR